MRDLWLLEYFAEVEFVGEWSEGNEEGKRKRVLFYIVRIARSFWGQLSTAMSFISSFDVFDRKTGRTAVPSELNGRMSKPCIRGQQKQIFINSLVQSNRINSLDIDHQPNHHSKCENDHSFLISGNAITSETAAISGEANSELMVVTLKLRFICP